jgi:hypothetical protein
MLFCPTGLIEGEADKYEFLSVLPEGRKKNGKDFWQSEFFWMKQCWKMFHMQQYATVVLTDRKKAFTINRAIVWKITGKRGYT